MADPVVMGTEGRSKIEEMIIGSNTEKVIRHAKCSELTAHEKAATTDFKNIVYATAMAKNEKVFSGIIRCTQELYNSTIHLLRLRSEGTDTFNRLVIYIIENSDSYKKRRAERKSYLKGVIK